jgi:cytochrome c-type biogenesis protein CcmH/NrfF
MIRVEQKMRKFAFQELAYAIVVAAAYGLIIGIYIPSNIFIIFLWVLVICAHLAGIYLLVHLEEQQKKSKQTNSTKENTV